MLNLNDSEKNRYRYVDKYVNHFSENELIVFENSIFGNLNKKQRIYSEYRRLREVLNKNTDMFAEYLDMIIDMEKKFKIIDFDLTVLDEISLRIVSIQIDINESVRLYSVLSRIKKELDYLSFLRENGEEVSYSSNRSRR